MHTNERLEVVSVRSHVLHDFFADLLMQALAAVNKLGDGTEHAGSVFRNLFAAELQRSESLIDSALLCLPRKSTLQR
jgi:hypothetical protein